MANEEVLGPRKTMFVLVIVVGCFAVLWPRILSPLVLGHTRDPLKPNEFDREAGCCEVMFETELAVLELINEVCNSAVHSTGKLSPYAAAQCRKAVNETCGMDIAVFLKRTENVGKTSKMLVQTMHSSNSSCLKENFGLTSWSHGAHLAINSWNLQDTMKQERPPVRGGPHPALLERGRAIPPGPPAASRPVAMPPHLRVRSPLSVYYELDIKPPPIPGMRPPLGSPGGPVPAPKSSMGFVMPIYTICIIVFFVYTLSKILFKRTAAPYETVDADPQFRRRVFREDSRTSPDKLVVTAISGLVAEVQQQMEANYGNQQRQDAQDNARPYTNGTILHNTGPVHIVASEYRDASKERSPEPKIADVQQTKESAESTQEDDTQDPIETSEDLIEYLDDLDETKEVNDSSDESKELVLDSQHFDSDLDKISNENVISEINETKPEQEEYSLEPIQKTESDARDLSTKEQEIDAETKEIEDLLENYELNHNEEDLIKLIESSEDESDVAKLTEYFIEEEKREEEKREKQSTPEVLEDALKEDSPEQEILEEPENASVKVMGMEVTAHSADGGACDHETSLPTPQQQTSRPHEAEDVKSIFLQTEIPQKSKVLVTDFEENRPDVPKPNNSPMVVSGKMTLSLIQDARDTPERDPESTVDDFTTASAVTQPAADKAIEESDEEIEEEIEIEEIEEEVEEEEEEEIETKDEAKVEPGKVEPKNKEKIEQEKENKIELNKGDEIKSRIDMEEEDIELENGERIEPKKEESSKPRLDEEVESKEEEKVKPEIEGKIEPDKEENKELIEEEVEPQKEETLEPRIDEKVELKKEVEPEKKKEELAKEDKTESKVVAELELEKKVEVEPEKGEKIDLEKVELGNEELEEKELVEANIDEEVELKQEESEKEKKLEAKKEKKVKSKKGQKK